MLFRIEYQSADGRRVAYVVRSPLGWFVSCYRAPKRGVNWPVKTKNVRTLTSAQAVARTFTED